MATTVVLIEDETSISEPLQDALATGGFDVSVATTGGAGLRMVAEQSPDIVLLDLGLPDMDGRDVCRRLRETSTVPIIMLTARGMETDRVVGLEIGADDYVTKPFSLAELTARMRAVLRRSTTTEPVATPEPVDLTIGGLHLDERTWTVTMNGAALNVTRREFELLRLLMRHAGTVLTRERLMEEVWDENWFGPTKTLDVHVSALRRKINDDPAEPRYIHTVRGVGFRFASEAELAP
jgi:DNA-binding response OmpR family regulator